MQEVVFSEPLSRRVEVLARWIDVCERLYFNRNFHSLLTVLSGLNHVSVLRLARTWAKLSQTYVQSTSQQLIHSPKGSASGAKS